MQASPPRIRRSCRHRCRQASPPCSEFEDLRPQIEFKPGRWAGRESDPQSFRGGSTAVVRRPVRDGPLESTGVRRCGCLLCRHSAQIWRGWMGIEPTQDAQPSVCPTSLEQLRDRLVGKPQHPTRSRTVRWAPQTKSAATSALSIEPDAATPRPHPAPSASSRPSASRALEDAVSTGGAGRDVAILRLSGASSGPAAASSTA